MINIELLQCETESSGLQNDVNIVGSGLGSIEVEDSSAVFDRYILTISVTSHILEFCKLQHCQMSDELEEVTLPRCVIVEVLPQNSSGGKLRQSRVTRRNARNDALYVHVSRTE